MKDQKAEREAVLDKVSWTKITKDKADFIYKEALVVQKEIWDSLNVLNDKAFRLLAMLIPVQSVLIGAILSQAERMSRPVLAASISGALLLMGSMISLGVVVWPRRLRHTAGEPMVYLASSLYRKPMTEILRSSICAAWADIDYNSAVQTSRGRWLRRGLALLISSPLVSALVFVGLFIAERLFGV